MVRLLGDRRSLGLQLEAAARTVSQPLEVRPLLVSRLALGGGRTSFAQRISTSRLPGRRGLGQLSNLQDYRLCDELQAADSSGHENRVLARLR